MKVENAILKDGNVFCKCGKPLGNAKDYFLVEVNGKRYNQFIRRCTDKKCDIISQYCTDLENRFVFDQKDIKRIKDDNISN